MGIFSQFVTMQGSHTICITTVNIMDSEVAADKPQSADALDMARDFVDRAYRNQAMYLDTAKSYLQLASLGLGALWFLVDPEKKNAVPLPPVYAAAIFWGISIGSSIVFSFASTKWLTRVERKHLKNVAASKRTMPWGLSWTEENPAAWFNGMVITFFLGLIFFVVALMYKLG